MHRRRSFDLLTSHLNRPLTAAAVVALFYILFTLVGLALHDWNPLWFVWLGPRYLYLDPEGFTGYDGQFIYYLASAGWDALPHLDNPPYRLQRILLPVVARLLSFGGLPGLVPWVLLLVNGLAIVGTTYLLAVWLREKQVSPWIALLYGLYIGTFMAYSRDLTEPLALALAAAAALSWLRGRLGAAVVLLALAILTKETMLLFLFALVPPILLRRRLPWPEKIGQAALAAAAALPFLVWEGYLFQRFGTIPLISGPSMAWIPLSGILPHLAPTPELLTSFFAVALPAAGLLLVALPLLVRHPAHPAPWWLFVHALFVVLFPFDVYDHILPAGRNASGLVLSFLFVAPFLPRPLRLLPFPFWVAPTFVWLVPVLRWSSLPFL